MKYALFALMLCWFGSWQPLAARPPVPAVPSYAGAPNTDEARFQKFIIGHLNQRVHLQLNFGAEEMVGYKSGDADPFLALRYTYFFDCLEKQAGIWTARCAALHFDPATNSLSGYFYVTEPRPRTMRTNRSFTLKPVK